MPEDYCDLCDLPRSTCVHGMPPPPPPAPPAPKPARVSRAVRPKVTRQSATLAAPTRRAPRKWTSPEELAPHIVGVLQQAGGELDAPDLFDALETRLGDDLLEGDRQLTPEGELRWRYAARRARQTLIGDGVMSKGAPGAWKLC